MSHRYDDMRAWLNPDDAPDVWTRRMTDDEVLAVGLAFLSCAVMVVVFVLVVLRW